MKIIIIHILSTVCFQMCPQISCLRGHIVTLVTFIRLFSTVRFQMCPQIACQKWCKITLVAFVWLFSTVRFQMSPQTACLRRCIVTLVTFIWFFSTVCFLMCLQNVCPRRGKVTLVAFVWLFSTVRLKMFLRRCNVTLHPLTKCLFRRLSSPLFSGLSFHKTKNCYLRPNISDHLQMHHGEKPDDLKTHLKKVLTNATNVTLPLIG